MLRLATLILGVWIAGPGLGFAQGPVLGGTPATGRDRPINPSLLEAMNLYKGFVAPPDRLVALKALRLEVTSVNLAPKPKTEGAGLDKPEKGEETSGAVPEEEKNSFTLTLAFAPSFFAWKVRMDGTAKGQKLVLVGTPGSKGQAFGVLGDPPVLQGHPAYAQRAHQMANEWGSFVLRWLNPDLPLFRAEYENKETLPNGHADLRILMGVRNTQGIRESAWRLHIDAATGQPIALETFNPKNFKLLEKMVFQGFFEVSGIRFPKACLLYNRKGVKTGEIRFESFQLDPELPAGIFEKPPK